MYCLLTCHYLYISSFIVIIVVVVVVVVVVITGSLADLEPVSEIVLATPNEGQFY